MTEQLHLLFILLFIGFIILVIDKKNKQFPVPMVLLLLGIALSFVPYFSSLYLTKDIIFMVFLPALLFASAYKFPVKDLKKNASTIAVLASIGLILTTLLFGGAIYALAPAFADISFVGALLIAAILTPTDPVSVTSILEKTSEDKNISTIVEGESMINDGTSVVVFTIVAAMFVHGETFSVGSFLGEFLLVSLGGTAIGLAAGWIITKAVHYMHQHVYQVMLSLLAAYGSFYIAEAAGVSGVLATVCTGIMVSYALTSTENEDNLRSYLDGFWNVLEPIILSLLFLLIGIQAADYLVFDGWLFAVVIFILSLLVRFVVLGGVLHNPLSIPASFSWTSISIITWSGLKGTVSVALLLSIEADPNSQADMIVSLTFAAIVLSLVIQSLGEYPIMKKVEK
ncbi:sodium/proton antiporter (CPA1 family) [Sinobaca qinghaiensis]|uniref:Sodium/proton antiporter (CPA1 family) n=1 Tax=Sinobaca qinghaiensis TaxID=342944 RepID=A0A419V8J2_9BACL|nr:sodium:proton antiporter [Sinobaca qinghaiensis]RKD76273.1 sodium/proton antiporter (CPA1 family) [Sinobaca qinghaiensis]